MKLKYEKPSLNIKEYTLKDCVAENIFSQIFTNFFEETDEELMWEDLL